MNCGDLKKLFEKISKNVEEISGNIHFFFHYPFHDLRHCREMYKYLEDLRYSNLDLGYSELWLLRTAIYLHDIGMFLNPRNWHKLRIPKDVLSLPGEDSIKELTRDAVVKSFLDGLGMSFEDAFFDENNCLRLPPQLKGKPWDEFSLLEKIAVRTVMRELHPQIGDWAVRRKFIGEYPPECRKISEIIGGIVRLHEDKDSERIRNLGSWEIAGSLNIDQRKLTAILILLDSLDCVGQSRASPETLDEIMDDIRMLEEKMIEIEAEKGDDISKGCGHLPHWVFKKYIKRIEVCPSRITVVVETTSPSYLAGILFFEMSNNVWPKYALASKILKEYGYHFDLVVQIPSPVCGEQLMEEELAKLEKEFSEIIVETSELPREFGEKYKIGLKLPRALALLLSYGGSYKEYADQLAKKHVCRLLAKLGNGQRSLLEKIFKCG